MYALYKDSVGKTFIKTWSRVPKHIEGFIINACINWESRVSFRGWLGMAPAIPGSSFAIPWIVRLPHGLQPRHPYSRKTKFCDLLSQCLNETLESTIGVSMQYCGSGSLNHLGSLTALMGNSSLTLASRGDTIICCWPVTECRQLWQYAHHQSETRLLAGGTAGAPDAHWPRLPAPDRHGQDPEEAGQECGSKMEESSFTGRQCFRADAAALQLHWQTVGGSTILIHKFVYNTPYYS